MNLTEDGKHLVIQTRSPEVVKKLIPSAHIEHDVVMSEVYVPYSFIATRILSSAGVNLSGFEYSNHRFTPPLIEGRHELYPHQVRGVGFMSTHGRAFNLFQPRMGKTATTEATIQFLEQERVTSSALITAPLSTLYSVWEKEIAGMDNESVCVLHSEKHTGEDKIAWMIEKLSQGYRRYLINPAAFRVEGIVNALVDWRDKNNIQFIGVDESTEFGRQSTKQWKGLNKVTGAIKHIHLLTGTPGDPTKIHGQVRLIYPSLVPKNQEVWKMRTMYEVSQNVWIPKPEAIELVEEVMKPAIRVKREDVIKDMPKVIYMKRCVPMNSKVAKLYDTIRADGIVELMMDGVSEVVRAVNAGVLANKLVQISSGVLMNEGRAKRLPIDLKIDDLCQVIDQSEYKVIIVTQIKETLKYLNEKLLKKGYTTALVNGDTSAKKRGEIFTTFQKSKNPHVLLAHPTTIKFGVELGAASTLVIYSPILVGEIAYEQLIARLLSVHQRSEQPVVCWMYSTNDELKMMKRMEKKMAWNVDLADVFIQK